eukprot:1875130-Prymnesium_polylepis.1
MAVATATTAGDNTECGAPAGEEAFVDNSDAASAVSVAQVETLGLSEAVLKLSASDDGHRTIWAGRVRGGAEVPLDGGW